MNTREFRSRLIRYFFPFSGARDFLRWMWFSALIGIVAGIGAMIFSEAISAVGSLSLGNIAHYFPPLPGSERTAEVVNSSSFNRFLLLIIPALGGLLSGLIVYSFAPEAEGHGTDAVIDAFHNKRGKIRPIVPVIKIIASALTIGTGGSAGREGPIAQIGAGFGSLLGNFLKLSIAETRQMLIIGMGAGIGAIFRAPLGGAIFATTVLYRETDYEHGALMPSFLASIMAYAVYTSLIGHVYSPIFSVSGSFVFHPVQLPFYLLLGTLMVPLCYLYVRTFYNMRNRVFRKINLPRYYMPAVGGLMLGILAFFFSPALGSGYGWIQEALDGNVGIKFLLILTFVKIIATSFTISSGGSGGVFAPSLVIGGAFGGVIGNILYAWQPNIFPQPAAFVLVGMAAFFAAAAKVPIASLIMVSEMTGGYSLLVPSMLAIAVAFMLSSKRISIYEKQVDNRLASPAHRGDYVIDVLEEITVQKVIRTEPPPQTIRPETKLAEILRLFTSSYQSVFPVLDRHDKFSGFVPIDLIRGLPQDTETGMLIIAYDIMEKGPIVSPDDDLHSALHKLIMAGINELPVVNKNGKIVALLSRRELLTAYYDRMKELRNS